MKSNDRARCKFAKMNVLDRHLSYIFRKINFTKEQGQYVIVLKKFVQ